MVEGSVWLLITWTLEVVAPFIINAEVSSFFATSAVMLEAWQGMPKVQVCPCRRL